MKREEAQKRSEEALDELAKALEQGRSDTLVSYLATLSRFHRYSFGNCILIAIQRQDATHVAGFHRWKELGRYVKKGEQGIAILAPLLYKRKPDEKTEQRKDEGSDHENARTLRGFKAVHVFDVSQTDGQPLPEFAGIVGDPGEKLQKLEEVVRGFGIELCYDVIPGGPLGVSTMGKIMVRPDLPPAEKFSVLCHELGHELLHEKARRKEASKTVLETEAEAVAFVVSRAAGLEGTTRAADYIQLYAGGKEVLLESLERIQKTSSAIIEALETEAKPEEVSHAA